MDSSNKDQQAALPPEKNEPTSAPPLKPARPEVSPSHTAPDQPPKRGVMDVRPPATQKSSGTSEAAAPAPVRPRPVSAPGSAQPLKEAPKIDSSAKESEPTPPKDSVPGSPKEVKAVRSSDKQTPRLAIVLAFVIAIVLAGLTVAAYLYTQKDSDTDKKEESGASQGGAADPATSNDVDSATQAVDEVLESGEASQDLPEEDFNDQTLGL